MATKKGDPRLSRKYREVRLRVLARDGYVCFYCGHEGQDGNNLTIDHIIPVSKSPELAIDESNMRIACKSCNSRKGSRNERVFLDSMRTRPNAQTLLTSNAGDAFSLVLNGMRERALENPPKSFGFYEYSAPQWCKITDRQAWAMANPALGYTISESSLEESVATSPIENTRTELLCQWISSLQSPFPPNSIEDCSDATLTMSAGAYTVFAFDKSPSSRDAALIAGQILPDGRIGIGVLQTWESQVSVDELHIARDIKAFADLYRPRFILHDKYATQTIADRLTNSGQICMDISGAQFYQACSDLLDATVNKRWVHNGQDILITQFSNVAAKTNDSSWRIIKRQSAGSVAIPISVAMAISTLMKPQQVAGIYTE
jgi:hypothetical protein